MNSTPGSFRAWLGCWLHERWRAELALLLPSSSGTSRRDWRGLRNRRQRLARDTRSGGWICEWTDSCRLTVARIFPGVAIRLLRRALQEWPIHFADADASQSSEPQVSILIPIGGTSRLPQFELTLAAARAQGGVAVEVVVVEQSPSAELSARVPADVRYFHQESPFGQAGFNKSWALNRAAREARAAHLIILDADMLLPANFAAEVHEVLLKVAAVRPTRLMFCLDQASTQSVCANRGTLAHAAVSEVIANAPMPIAVRRSRYWEVGGHDEGYSGWGGEDTEFLERLRTGDVCEGGWMPIVHAWHAPAAKKADGDRNRGRHAERMRVPADARIRLLRQLELGGSSPKTWSSAEAGMDQPSIVTQAAG